MQEFYAKPREMTAEQVEWLEFCRCAYKGHMHNLNCGGSMSAKLIENPVEIFGARLVCVAAKSGPPPDSVMCMAFFNQSGEVVGFVDCVHDVIFEWPDLPNMTFEHVVPSVALN